MFKHIYFSNTHPDANSEVEEKVSGYDDNVRDAEGLRQSVEVDSGVRHPYCSQNNEKQKKCTALDSHTLG